MENLIKREDAIDAIEGTDWYHQNRNKDMVSGANSDEHQAWYKAEDVYKALKEVPSADAELEIIKAEAYAKGIDSERKRISDWCRPSGEWIRDGHHIRCKKCGAYFCDTDREGDSYPQDFCPNCGARMKGANTDIDCFDTCKHAYSEVCDECYKGNKYDAAERSRR